jgi:hypothetical protein
LPIVFTSGQLLPCAGCPTLIAWIWDKEHALQALPESKDIPQPIVPRYEETWLKQPSQKWYSQGLLTKMTLKPMPGVPHTTMLVVNGPPTTLQGITCYFHAIATATEEAADWRASDNELEEWAKQLADITPPLDRRTEALVRWIAALNHLANP